MPTLTKVWEITEKGPVEVANSDFAATHQENELEDWIVKDPNILGEDLIVISEQPDIRGVGRPDLLLMDSTGKLVIVELKRDVSPREAVAQALDYASWLDGATEDEIKTYAKEHLKRELDEAFEDHFHTEPPEWVCQNHRILIVAARLDESAERIINYLAERHHVDINAIFFTYAKLGSGKEVLIRSVLVPEGPVGPGPRGRFTEASLMAVAADHDTVALVDVCRKMRSVWREQSASTGGGSFRYWTDKPGGGAKMVFGVNVSGGISNPPRSELDVWVRTDALAEVTGIADEEIRQRASALFPPFSKGFMDFVIRLKSAKEAEQLIGLLQAFSRPPTKVSESGNW